MKRCQKSAVALIVSVLITNTVVAADMKSVARKALLNPDVEVKEKITGEDLDSIQKMTTSKEPVMAIAKVIHKFQQKGCGRVAIILVQDKVPTVEGPIVPFGMRVELNLCPDGTPPAEGVNYQPEDKGGKK